MYPLYAPLPERVLTEPSVTFFRCALELADFFAFLLVAILFSSRLRITPEPDSGKLGQNYTGRDGLSTAAPHLPDN